MDRRYLVSAVTMAGASFYDDKVYAGSPKKAVAIFVRAHGGGPLSDIYVTEAKNCIVNKPTDLFLRVDLLGGTRESATYFKAHTKVNWLS